MCLFELRVFIFSRYIPRKGLVDHMVSFSVLRNLQLLFVISLVAQPVKSLPVMWETWVWSLGWEDALEKEMATHFSILAWRIPWTEEPHGLQSMGSQRVRHDWVTHFHFHTACHTGYTSLYLGPPKTDRSWWRGLTECGYWRREWQTTSVLWPWEPHEQ